MIVRYYSSSLLTLTDRFHAWTQVVNATQSDCLISALGSPTSFAFTSVDQAAQYYTSKCFGIDSSDYYTTFTSIAAIAGGNEYSAYGFLAALGCAALEEQPLPPYPPRPPAPPSIQPAAATTVNVNFLVGVLVGSFVFVLIVASLIVYIIYKKRGGFFTRTFAGPPGPGPDTTLVVSDIMDSTILWEVLEPDVMNAALGIHHECIRKLLPKHGGEHQST